MSGPRYESDRTADILLAATEVALSGPLDDEIAFLGLGEECLPIFALRRLDGPPPDPMRFAIAQFVPEHEITMFTGEGGVGKSLCAQQMATCMAARLPFLGLSTSIRDNQGVLYVTAEEGEDELERRQRAINRRLGLRRIDIDGLLHLSSLRGNDGNELCSFDADGTIRPTAAFNKLGTTICRAHIGTVILDNVAHLFGGNENIRREVTAFVNLLYRLVRAHSCTIVLIAHPNKSGNSYSGSTGWLNAVRSQIFLERLEDTRGHEPEPTRRVLVNPKANYAQRNQRHVFRFHDGAFALDADLPMDDRAEIERAHNAAVEDETFLRCLRARTGPGREVGPSPGPNYAPARFPEMSEAKGMKNQAFKRAMERLIFVGRITTKEVKRDGKGNFKTIIVEVDPGTPKLPPEPIPNTVPNVP